MPRYNFRLIKTGEPCRKVHLTYLLTATEEKTFLQWAKRREWKGSDAQLVRRWLYLALYSGIDSLAGSESESDELYRGEPEEGQPDGALY